MTKKEFKEIMSEFLEWYLSEHPEEALFIGTKEECEAHLAKDMGVEK